MRNTIMSLVLPITISCSSPVSSVPDAGLPLSCSDTEHLPQPPDRPVLNPVRIVADGLVITSADFVMVQNYINGTHMWMSHATELLNKLNCGIDETMQQP